MELETITGQDGIVWTRSADRKTLTASDGRTVLGNPEMPNDYLLTFAYPEPSE
jgi:hypothetical protein